MARPHDSKSHKIEAPSTRLEPLFLRSKTFNALNQSAIDFLSETLLWFGVRGVSGMKLRISTIPILILTLALALWTVFPSRARGQGQRAEQEPQRPDTIKVNTALVTVPVVVTDGYGRFVTGLSQNDFRLQE